MRRGKGSAWQDDPEKPVALVAETAGRIIVTAVSDAASAAGIAPEMALADARAVLPGLRTMPADPAADAALRNHILSWCGRYTPFAAPEGTDGIWLDVTGCAHLFGGEQAMLDDLLMRLRGMGLRGRASLTDTPGAAWALSHYGAACSIVPSEAIRDSIAGLPVAALRLGAAASAGLTRLGLKRVGDLYALPRAPLTARFSGEVSLRLDQALGLVEEPISPRQPPPRYRVRLAFPDPIGLTDDIEAGLRRLLHDLCERLGQAQRGCRRLDLTLYRVDGSLQTVSVGTSVPARDAAHLARLFAERLGTLDAGFGVEVMVLAAPVTEPLGAVQIDSPASNRPPKKPSSRPKADKRANPPSSRSKAGRGQKDPSSSPTSGRGQKGPPARQNISPLLDRLGNRLGFDQVVALRPRASFLPEYAVETVPAAAGDGDVSWRPGPVRPLRLLARPELLDTLAAVPEDGPPAAFRWRRVQHRLKAAEGPERIAPEWWRLDPGWDGGARDYWRVEDETGRRFWLFREVRPRRDGTSRWFLHGLFA